MSSVWARLEALAASGAELYKCPCDKSDHAGWTFNPAKEERIDGFPPLQDLHSTLEMVVDVTFNRLRGHMPLEARQKLRLTVRKAPALLAKNQFYRVPQSAEEDRRRFRHDMRELWEPIKVLAACPDQGWGAWEDWDWANNVAEMEKEAPEDMLERLIWHHDPRLQLIRFPSFRCFVEVQLLHRSLRVAMQDFRKTFRLNLVSKDWLNHIASKTCCLFSNSAACLAFYVKRMEDETEEPVPISGLLASGPAVASAAGLSLTKAQQKANKTAARLAKETAASSSRSDFRPKREIGPAPVLPAASSVAEEADPSLSKSQRKRAQQKASKAAVRLAKEQAANSSRPDYLPKMPAPKPPAAKARKAVKEASASDPQGTSRLSQAMTFTEEPCGQSPEPQGETDQAAQSERPALMSAEVGASEEPTPSSRPEARFPPPLGEPAASAELVAPEVSWTPGPGAEEAAAVPHSPTEEPREPSQSETEVQGQTDAPNAPTKEAPFREPMDEAVPAEVRPTPAVEAVVPSGAYAVLAHDLARIADRLRQARLAQGPR